MLELDIVARDIDSNDIKFKDLCGLFGLNQSEYEFNSVTRFSATERSNGTEHVTPRREIANDRLNSVEASMQPPGKCSQRARLSALYYSADRYR